MIDAEGRAVIPGFVDSHAHLVFAGDRTRRVRRAHVRHVLLRRRHQDDRRGDPGRDATTSLRSNLARLVAEALRSGTTTIECKSGYGLTVADETRSLRTCR